MKKKSWLSYFSKSAQVSQAFTYIAIVLLISFAVIFGFKSLSGLFKSNCDNDNLLFVKDIKRFVDEYSDLNSVHIEKMKAPCDAIMLCFVDASCLGPPSSLCPYLFDAVIKSSADDGTANIFVKREFMEPILVSSKVFTTPDKVFCINATDGYFDLRFTGRGRGTLVEKNVP